MVQTSEQSVNIPDIRNKTPPLTKQTVNNFSDRHFLFLQGPHGPFFDRLARKLGSNGAKVCRVGFNAGDQFFWRLNADYIPYTGPPENWPNAFKEIVKKQNITDIVLYGDTREVHAKPIEVAQKMGVAIHVFEEGYIRPYWVTYERNGSNGHSPLMNMSIDDMRRQLPALVSTVSIPPAHWGDMRQHIFYSAVYHWFVLFRNSAYRNFKPHRKLSLRQETFNYTRRLALMPYIAIRRRLAARRIRKGGFEFDLALLQLEHDASFLAHSPFSSMDQFIAKTIEGFAKGAAKDRHLVFKSHPLESEHAPTQQIIEDIGELHGVSGRLHYLQGGKLGKLMDAARSVITINSTAAQQALWRGLPVKALGDAVYAKPELVSALEIAEFFATLDPPDQAAYLDFRRYLLQTSQIPGGFYAAQNRKQAIEVVASMILEQQNPYEAAEIQRSSAS